MKAWHIARDGSYRVPIYRTARGYVVCWYEHGRRIRKSFTDPAEAKRLAADKVAAAAAVGSRALVLSQSDAEEFQAARELAAQWGASVAQAVREWSDAVAELSGGSLVAAMQDYSRLRPARDNAPTVEAVVGEYLAAKRGVGRSAVHLRDLRTRLGKLSAAVRMPIGGLTVPVIEAWLVGLGVTGRNRNNYLSAAASLVRFAERRGYVARGLVDTAAIERARVTGEVGIFTPDELRRLLTNATPRLLPLLALGAFAGLRTAEANRIDWADIGEEHINVRAEHAKTRRRRLVPVLSPLLEWLAPYRQPSGLVAGYSQSEHAIADLAQRAGVQWKRNGLRHSFGTYRMALLKNENAVALEMGNSPAMIFANYRAISTEETARAWFSVRP